MTTQDSFYLERLKTYLSNNEYFLTRVGHETNSRWNMIGSRQALEYNTKFVVKNINYHEQEYKGFQLIVKETIFEVKTVLDKNGLPTKNYIEENEITGYINQQDQSLFVASAYEIGGWSDSIANLAWYGQGAVIHYYGKSDQLKKTLKTAQKKLDILSQAKIIKDTLIQIADERLNYNEAVNPFNVSVGDQVWVDAHGRKRKGVITSTTGSRFNVVYLTPSNHEDLKYKTVGIPNMYVKENP
jgi:hypothetical protein